MTGSGVAVGDCVRRSFRSASRWYVAGVIPSSGPLSASVRGAQSVLPRWCLRCTGELPGHLQPDVGGDPPASTERPQFGPLPGYIQAAKPDNAGAPARANRTPGGLCSPLLQCRPRGTEPRTVALAGRRSEAEAGVGQDRAGEMSENFVVTGASDRSDHVDERPRRELPSWACGVGWCRQRGSCHRAGALALAVRATEPRQRNASSAVGASQIWWLAAFWV